MIRVLALAAALLALGAGPAAAARTSLEIDEVQASASTGSATVTWRTNVPARGRIVYGVGALDLFGAPEPAPATTHSDTIANLEPGTTYSYTVVAAADGASTTAWGAFTTAAPSQAPRFGVEGTHVTADGSLFFPVLSYEQCADTVDEAVAMGVNTFVQAPYTGCDYPARITPPYVLSDDYADSRGVGWYLPDEPDGAGISPDQLPQFPLAAQAGRLRVLNISQHFYSGQAPINATFDRNEYKQFAALADVVGFDMYPIVKFCGRVPLLDMFRAQRELMTIYAPGKPTFQWIETSQMTGECPTLQITPEIVNAESWLAVAGGACGIGYFTNSWTAGVWNRWDFDPGVREQIAQTTAALQALAPALCATYGDATVPRNAGVAASTRTMNGALYVVAVNSRGAPATVPIRVDALAGRTLTVLGEGRTIVPVTKSTFRDTFAPYAVHLYLATPVE